MSKNEIHIPHFTDNYHEMCSAVSTIITVHDKIKTNEITIAHEILSTEVFADDPEVNESIKSYSQNNIEESVSRMITYASILLACAGIEKVIRLIIQDTRLEKKKKECHADYLLRISENKIHLDKSIRESINDLFILRNWIAHRSGRIKIQKQSKEESCLLRKYPDSIIINDLYIDIEYGLVKKIMGRIDSFLKQLANELYKQ